MKHKILLLIMAISAIAFVSCQKQRTTTTPESVAVITQPIDGGEPAEAGTRAVTIAATCDWTAVSNDSWISVSPASGKVGMKEVILTFQENTTGEVRVGSVTFKAGTYSESFTLTQKAK